MRDPVGTGRTKDNPHNHTLQLEPRDNNLYLASTVRLLIL